MRTSIKIGVASLAFLPPVVLVLIAAYHLQIPLLKTGATVLEIPALLMIRLADAFCPDRNVAGILAVVATLLWSSVMAIVLWKYTGMLLNEDEPEGEKFDWVGFRLRFFLGFIVGFLVGWRFVRYSDKQTILIAMILSGVLGGFAFGAWRENFWQRPL
jgi:hypothetical protein